MNVGVRLLRCVNVCVGGGGEGVNVYFLRKGIFMIIRTDLICL